MFCHKCGGESIEDSAFCQKCGTKLLVDETMPQPSITLESEPAPEPVEPSTPPSAESAQEVRQAPSNNTSAPVKAGGGFRSIATVGRVIMGISLLLLFLSSFLRLPISPFIIVIGVAAGIILTTFGIKRPWGLSVMLELAVAGVLLVAVIISAAVSSGGTGNSDKYVQMVKGGTLDGYPQKTVGRAFDDFLINPRWESGISENGERFVNVKGGARYFDKEVELAVQFFIDENNDTFTYNASEVNGIPQNNLVFWDLLETIYSGDFTSPALNPPDNSPALAEPPKQTADAPVETEPAPATESQGLIYTHSTLGFTLAMPEDWENLCLISESEYGVSFFSESNYDLYGGFLFGIYMGYESEFEYELEFGAEIIWRDGDLVAIYSGPTDIQFDYTSPALQEEYGHMAEAIPDIVATFEMD